MTRLNLGAGAVVLPGFANLDKTDGWRFEDGLGQYPDGSVEGITISHALMFVALPGWPAMFAEFARVLRPGGVLRITEDSTADPRSERYGGHHDAVTLTSPELVLEHMRGAGLEARRVGAHETAFCAVNLSQQLHGSEPKVFFCEGQKPGGVYTIR